MTSDLAIKLNNVSKTFWINEKSNDSIRERFSNFFSSKTSSKEVNALCDINLEIRKGEFFGIVGHNGSGKSTLLKLIIGAIKPNKGGSIKTNGKVLRLALGMGFDPNLSARHNIYVNGSIMGLTFREIGKNFDEIIDFSGLVDFVDTPIKFYSSGMVSRLAFAISMHVEADILLIDEFFGGVGDEAFRQKSADKFKESIIKGKTIVFVSHEMSLIKQHCNRACVIHSGKIVALGSPSDVIQPYINSYN